MGPRNDVVVMQLGPVRSTAICSGRTTATAGAESTVPTASMERPSTRQRPPASGAAGTRFAVPMKLATNAFAGDSYSSRGGASCSSRPLLITPTRSEIARASCWSWVTKIVVTPISSCRRLISSRKDSRTFASSADRGSSSRSTRGDVAMARANATRCF